MNGHNHNIEKLLLQLKTSAQKIVETRGYTKEIEKLRILEELLKEQVKNENSSHSTRTTR